MYKEKKFFLAFGFLIAFRVIEKYFEIEQMKILYKRLLGGFNMPPILLVSKILLLKRFYLIVKIH